MRATLALRAAAVVLLSASATTYAALPAAAAAATTADAVTVNGRGEFADLRVTVSDTKELRNEVVQVTWTGGQPTRGNFGVHYLQVFQCWGDDSTGPQREQCQFGGLTGDQRGGAHVASRQVTYDIEDPLESYQPTPEKAVRYVPFRSVSGKTTEAGLSEFFDGTTTNEVPFAATRSDGGGVVPFEVQTSREAPGLGCGDARTTSPAAAPRSDTATATATPTAVTRSAGAPRSCWLVIVPRGEQEVDGSRRNESSTGQLLSSPLSATNWEQRLVVPLTFALVGQPCPLGKAERPVVGQENAVEAVSSWQPALCAGNGPLYSFSQVPDAVARRQAIGDAPALSLTSRPVPSAEVPVARRPVYAPVALTGITVAFNIESQSAFSAPAEVKARDGQRITDLSLNPRLVAKLLTQSYRLGAADPNRTGIEKNPFDLTKDPEFLRLNPAFAPLRFNGIPDILVPAGQSDAGGAVWQWLLGDRDAKAFLGGAADPDGMVVNPAYKGVGQQDGFPKSDPVCRTFASGQPPLCTLDARPYAADLQDAARAAARGDTLSRSTYDTSATPPVYRKSLPQPTGSRAILALTDAATAHRFGLATAKLRNASGAFVGPTDAALLAAVAAAKPTGVAGVVGPDPAGAGAGAYPLTALTYALTTPEQLSTEARKDYATFLRYAVGDGQRPGEDVGQLPPGYAPLPAAMRAASLAAATRIEQATAPGLGEPAPDGAADVEGDQQAQDLLPAGPPLAIGGVIGAPDPGSAPLPFPTPVPRDAPAVAAPAPTPLVLAGRTPYEDVGAARYGVVAALALGGLAALLASYLRRITGRTARAAA